MSVQHNCADCERIIENEDDGVILDDSNILCQSCYVSSLESDDDIETNKIANMADYKKATAPDIAVQLLATKIGIFETPESCDAILDSFSDPGERAVAAIVLGQTWNIAMEFAAHKVRG